MGRVGNGDHSFEIGGDNEVIGGDTFGDEVSILVVQLEYESAKNVK